MTTETMGWCVALGVALGLAIASAAACSGGGDIVPGGHRRRRGCYEPGLRQHGLNPDGVPYPSPCGRLWPHGSQRRHPG